MMGLCMQAAVNSPVLVLNQDYAPLNICGVRRAVVLVLKEKAQLLENGRGELHAVGDAFPIPTVIRLVHMVKRPIFTRRLSRREVFWRDDFTPVLRQAAGRADTRPRRAPLPGRQARVGQRRDRMRCV